MSLKSNVTVPVGSPRIPRLLPASQNGRSPMHTGEHRGGGLLAVQVVSAGAGGESVEQRGADGSADLLHGVDGRGPDSGVLGSDPAGGQTDRSRHDQPDPYPDDDQP